MARSKFIEGKVVYQREPAVRVYHARQYMYADGRLTLHAAEQRVPGERPLPPDALKRLATPGSTRAQQTGSRVRPTRKQTRSGMRILKQTLKRIWKRL